MTVPRSGTPQAVREIGWSALFELHVFTSSGDSDVPVVLGLPKLLTLLSRRVAQLDGRSRKLTALYFESTNDLRHLAH